MNLLLSVLEDDGAVPGHYWSKCCSMMWAGTVFCSLVPCSVLSSHSPLVLPLSYYISFASWGEGAGNLEGVPCALSWVLPCSRWVQERRLKDRAALSITLQSSRVQHVGAFLPEIFAEASTQLFLHPSPGSCPGPLLAAPGEA